MRSLFVVIILLASVLSHRAFACTCAQPTRFYVKGNQVHFETPGARPNEVRDEVLKGADPKTFRELKKGAERSKKAAETASADSITMTCECPPMPVWGRDAKHIFFRETQMEGVDVASFRVLHEEYARDKKQFYYGTRSFRPSPTEPVTPTGPWSVKLGAQEYCGAFVLPAGHVCYKGEAMTEAERTRQINNPPQH